ncbi:SpoIIE family protein phosphatase [Candidatus Parabeggiatoa sp. HSG14]|uniref:PP2C family protein-serine/threonine phosphatase n=1 Tax=Candidatus Parabeggiatoa sp. HSG14 TaxID=3055593 RepID=UPI0025A863AF|nr:SpoIIE family protein phosphatase [Thiotrichales bacterium HSG14]
MNTEKYQDVLLIVDDMPANISVLSDFLEGKGFEILIAQNGKRAIKKAEYAHPDLILLDVMMPEMDGFEACQILKSQDSTKEIPIIFMTALADTVDKVKGFELGAADYITKPIQQEEVLARVNAHLNLYKLQRQLAKANQKITTLNKQLKTDNHRMSAELNVSRKLQQMLLPTEKELQQIDGLEIAGFLEPADEIGGDYYDVQQRGNRVLCGIGDVTGHGLESGVLAIMTQTAVKTLLSNNETDSVKFLTALNETIYHNVQRMNCDKNLTLALLNYQNGQICLTGQHEEMIVVRQGELELIDTIDLGFPIGLDDKIIDFISEAKISLNAGDVVVLYTDGITEAENLDKEQFGLERLCDVIKQNWQRTAQEIREVVIDDVRQFIGKQKVFDDITLLVLKQQ